MAEIEDQGASGTKRLVLGFDAGCMTCSELARRIEDRVGDKLEVRSLRDPQVRHWRRTALGVDAPWVPTLIEVKGLKVRAWTGRRMGFVLSRILGPVAMWRVMQVLGELGLAKKAEELPIGAMVGGMNRTQFLKGVAGAMVALSMVPGATVLPTVAKAKTGQTDDSSSASTEGTSDEQEKAKKIVRSSKEFKNLDREQRQRTGDSLDLKRATVRVDKKVSSAAVGVSSFDKRRNVAAVFLDVCCVVCKVKRGPSEFPVRRSFRWPNPRLPHAWPFWKRP